MRYLKKACLAAAVPGLLLATGGTASANVEIPGDKAKTCKVTIDRKQENNGVYDVTRQEFDDGSCICYAYTGLQPQIAGIENNIKSLEQSKTCPNAKLMSLPGIAGVGAGIFGGAASPAVGFVGLTLPATAAAAATAHNKRVSP